MNTAHTFPLKHLRTQQARRKYLNLEDTPATPALADLGKPDVVGIIDPSDGTLQKDHLQKDLAVHVPQWPFLPPGNDPADYVTLQLQFTLTGADNTYIAVGPVKTFYPPIVPADFPLTLEFPQASIPRNGKLWVRYELLDHLNDTYLSAPIELICDSVAPWGDQPVPPLIAPNTVINEDYLASHPAGVEFDLPDYPDRAPGDKYEVFYLKEWSDDDTEYERPVALGLVDDELKIRVPNDAVRLLGDGRFYVVYYLYDKAQNRSRIRLPALLDVVLSPEPSDLQPPAVPLAEDDGVLSLEDAGTGVTVEINYFGNAKNEDRIAVTWGSTALVPEQIGSRAFPIPITVPSQVLHDEYGNATGILATAVSYRVLRGEAAYGPQQASFDVDFSVAGPERPDPDPDWPNPVNPALVAPTITSFTGLQNEIVPADRGEPATLTFEVFDGAANGQVVDFYWDGVLVTEARWTVDQGPGTVKPVTIPWSYIQAAGNNLAVPVHYTVRASLTPVNEQESLTQFVAVSAIDMTPDDLEFLGLTARGWLSCQSIWDPADASAPPSIRVQVPSSKRFGLPPNTTITLSWSAYDATAGGSLISGVEKTETLPLTDAMIADGFVWKVVPYDKHIEPIYAAAPAGGRASVSYVINTASPIASNATENKISIADQSTGASCDLQRP